jgi:F-type H+-transporting ATPase subunit b
MRTINLAAGEQNNFLLPNGTFFVELIIFLVVLFVFWRFIVPPVRKAMAERHDNAQQAIDDNNAATKKFEDARKRYAEALQEARTESGAIREEARAEGQRILDDMRQRAQTEVDEIVRRGEDELAQQREQAARELRSQVSDLSTELAGKVLGDGAAERIRQDGTVERVLGERNGRGEAR